MDIQYSKQAIKFLKKQAVPTKSKRRIVSAIENLPAGADGNWENIEEVKPDEIDINMLQEAANDPDCHVFVSKEEAYKEIGL